MIVWHRITEIHYKAAQTGAVAARTSRRLPAPLPSALRDRRQFRGDEPHVTPSLDSFKSRRTLTVGGKTYDYFSLPEAEKNGLAGISRLPFSLKVLLENLLRFEDGRTVTRRRHPRHGGVAGRRAPATARSPSARRAC